MLSRHISDVAVPEADKVRACRLAVFMALRVVSSTRGTVAFLAPMMLLLGWLLCRFPGLEGARHAMGLGLVLLCVLVVVASEEFGHAAACVQMGHPERLASFRVAHWRLGSTKLLVESYGTRFTGPMSGPELLEVTAAGPLFSLCVGAVLFGALWAAGVTRPGAHRFALELSALLLLLPLNSLLPLPSRALRLAFMSDGSRILQLRQQLGLSASALGTSMARALGRVFGYLLGPGREAGRPGGSSVRLLVLTSGVLLALDQLTKAMAQAHLQPGQMLVPPVLGLVGITYQLNCGMSAALPGRGLVADLLGPSTLRWSLVSAHVAACLALLLGYLHLRRRGLDGRLMVVALAFGLGAAVGNGLDRLVLGCGRDMFGWFGPGVFNLADVYGWCFAACFFLAARRAGLFRKRSEAQ